MTGPALLDTHAVLWWLSDDPRLSDTARVIVADARHPMHVSAASLWEIAIKRSLGKIEAPDDLPDVVRAEGLTLMPVGAAHAWAVRSLPRHHGDPFDRLLVAQARIESLPIVSADGQLDAYGIDRRW
ncbi:type II toxin-antitoxin system VapC family toxin [Patulibacter sp. SYSU D01012]|uniref:type II toxin-antitoxin system VapC family toxin n=1 Tax=Patulibacter sp. SYSU D01012 TaxID=2817381 RepID=UPI001B307A33